MEGNPLWDRYRIDRSPEAAARLVEAYYPLVASVCRRYLRRPQDVEDAAQETFVKLLRHADAIRGDLSGWLTTAAYSTCIDLIRRTEGERRRREQAGYLATPSVSTAAAAEQQLVHEAIQAKLYEALLQLDAADRELIIDRFVRKTPLRVIAKRAASSISTISRQTTQAMSDLAQVLRRLGVASADDLTVAEHFGDPTKFPPPANELDCDDGLRFAPDWHAVQWPLLAAATTVADATRAPSYLPGWTRPLRVGVFISHHTLIAPDRAGKSHAEHADGWRVREAWLQIGTMFLMLHPGYQFVGLIEQGTSGQGPIEEVLRKFEVYGGLIDAADAESLGTLDVILLGNNWVMTRPIARAFHTAVRSGVGLLNDCCWTDLFDWCESNADVRALSLAESPIYRFHTSPEHNRPMEAIIHEAHSVLPGLHPGMPATVPSCGPVYQVVRGARVLMSRNHWVTPQEHRLAGVGPLRPPVYVVGQLGKGRVAVVNVHAHRRLMMIPGVQPGYLDNLLCWLAAPRRPSEPPAGDP